jgi:protein arginine kinase
MICASCGEREASVFISRSSCGESAGLALCESCARKRGLSAGHGKIEINIEDLLSAPTEAEGQRPPASCPVCGMSLDRLRREGRLGCPSCADAFRPDLERHFRSRGEAPFFRDEAFNVASPGSPSKSASPAPKSVAPDEGEADSLVERSLLSDLARAGRRAEQAASAAGEGSFDVALWSEARLSRNFSGRPFAEARAPEIEGLIPVPLSAVSEPVKRALVENSRVSRGYAFEADSLVAVDSDPRRSYLFGGADQLCVVARLPGLAGRGAYELAREGLEGRAWPESFAFDPEFGYLSSRVEGCGTGLGLSAELHLPALAASGLLDKALRSLMAAGLAVRGFYGSDSGSAGELYEISTEWSYGSRASDMAAAFDDSLSRLAESERRARLEIARKESESILDRAGRAIGVLGHCRYIDQVEAVELLSTLRLAGLAGLASGVDAAHLGLLLRSLGPASLSLVARESGLAPRAARPRGEDRLRALFLAGVVEGVSLNEGGAPCSKA